MMRLLMSDLNEGVVQIVPCLPGRDIEEEWVLDFSPVSDFDDCFPL